MWKRFGLPCQFVKEPCEAAGVVGNRAAVVKLNRRIRVEVEIKDSVLVRNVVFSGVFCGVSSCKSGFERHLWCTFYQIAVLVHFPALFRSSSAGQEG